jgi:hypothetical protein
MGSQVARTSSDTARLLLGAPLYAVGWQEPVYVPTPAAGGGFTYTVDGRYFERVLAVSFQLVTDAVVANRFGQVFIQDSNGKAITSVPVGGTVVASTTLSVWLALNSPTLANSVSGGSFGYLPDLLLPPGWKVVLSVFGADPGDQVSNVVVLVQRYPNDTASQPAEY